MSISNQVNAAFKKSMVEDIALLLMRVAFGGSLFFLHGLGKWQKFGELSSTFPDPLNLGSPMVSLILALIGEVVGPLLIVLGLMTRWAAIPSMVTMGVAAFIVHAQDPWAKKELALLYFAGFVVIFLRGGGRLALDSLGLKKG